MSLFMSDKFFHNVLEASVGKISIDPLVPPNRKKVALSLSNTSVAQSATFELGFTYPQFFNKWLTFVFESNDDVV